jgi:hypothetical protein
VFVTGPGLLDRQVAESGRKLGSFNADARGTVREALQAFVIPGELGLVVANIECVAVVSVRRFVVMAVDPAPEFRPVQCLEQVNPLILIHDAPERRA